MEIISINSNLDANVIHRTFNSVELDLGCNTTYIVTSAGQIISTNYIRTGKAVELKHAISHDGYHFISLYVNNKKYKVAVHRIIALCFLPNPQNLPQVNHINENKADNRVDNLEWITAKDNINHGTCIKRRAGTHSKAIMQLSKCGKIIAQYPSIVSAELATGISNKHISSCCLKRYGRKTAGGFIWQYI